jgi:serine/threonine-protein kinase
MPEPPFATWPLRSGALVRALEQLWRQGRQPDPVAFLDTAGPCRPAEAAAVLAHDQWQRWHAGQRVPAEDYLRRCPAVAADPDAAVEIIYGEFLVRQDLGEQPAPAEYLGRFPEHAPGLRAQFELFQALERDGGGPSVATTLPAPPPSPAWAPFEVPGYEVLGELGRGGMGVVYKARQGPPLNRFVALKVIRPEALGTEAALARFRLEAGAIARLQHPNIVQIHEFGVHQGQPYCALEWVEGGTLSGRLAGVPVAPREAAELTATLARAMHHAHERGIVHRDLKPGNVLLTPNPKSEIRNPKQIRNPKEQNPKMARPNVSDLGHSDLGFVSDFGFRISDFSPKIADFGLAKRLDAPDGYTATGEILGTPSYMAPEQAEGRPEDVGPAADVYALGGILYVLLTGRPPFQAETPLATLEQVRLQEPVAPRLFQPRTPRDLETVCLACLRKEPGRRYASALALAEDLQRFLQGEPIRMRRTPPWERLLKWARRHPARALLGGTGLLAAAAVGLLLLLADSRERLRLAGVRSDVERQFGAGQLALTRGEWAEAQRLYGGALERIEAETALADLRWNYAQRALAEVELDLAPEAEADFLRAEEALRQAPHPGADYSLLLTRGRLHLRRNDLEAARDDFRRAAELRPDDWLASSSLAHVYRRQARSEEALQAIRRAQAADVPEVVRARLATEEGNILYLAGRPEAAVERCAAVASAAPGYAEAYRVQGLALAALGDPARAACAFDAYFRHGGTGDGDVFRASGHAHLRLGDYGAAVADYTAAFRFPPPAGDDDARADLHLHRGWAYFFYEAWPPAVADFDEALRLRPGDADAHAGRAYALIQLGDYRRGVADAEQALRLRSATPETLWFNVACAFAQASARARGDGRAALEADYRRQAVATLRQALGGRATPSERWLFWRDQMLLDKGLDPIREAPEVQALHRELQTAAGATRR